MPWTSSGEVSARTRIAGRPASATSRAASGLVTIGPLAMPGEAGRPVVIGRRKLLRTLGAVGGWASSGRTRATASARESGNDGSSAMSTRDPQRRLRAALADPDLEHPEPAVLDRELDVAQVGVVVLQTRRRTSRSSAATAGIRSSRTAIGSVRCVPATTSSPWASNMMSPYRAGSPVAGLRVKSTPVADVAPRLPKTIAWTVTAVPRSSGMPSFCRYARARSLFHDRKTASIAPAQLEPRIVRARRRRRRSIGSSRRSRSRQLRANASSPATRARPAVGRVVQAEVQDRVHHPGHRHRRARSGRSRAAGPTGRRTADRPPPRPRPSGRGAPRRARPASRSRGRSGRSRS